MMKKMMNLYRRVIVSAIAVMLLLFLVSCSENAKEERMPPSPSFYAAYQNVPPDGENLPLHSSVSHQLTEEGIFTGGNLILFHDFETGEREVFCPLPDCYHRDERCPASLGENGSYVLYHDTFYALTKGITTEFTEGGAWHFTFKRRGPLELEWEVLWEHTFSEFAGTNVNARLGGGYAAILANEISFNEETGEEYTSNSQLISIHLETDVLRETTLTLDFEKRTSYNLVGVAEGRAVLWREEFPDGIIPFPDFAIQNELSEEEAWEPWIADLRERRFNGIIVVELASHTMLEIKSGSEEKLSSFTSPTFVYQGVIYIHYDGAIVAYTLEEGATEEIIRVPDIVNWFVYDGRVFYITNDEEGAARFYYHVLESGECYQLVNEENKEVMIFSIHGENSEMFIGLHQGYWKIISKEDFYQERYEEATTP